jgi:hypothetical protein
MNTDCAWAIQGLPESDMRCSGNDIDQVIAITSGGYEGHPTPVGTIYTKVCIKPENEGCTPL